MRSTHTSDQDLPIALQLFMQTVGLRARRAPPIITRAVLSRKDFNYDWKTDEDCPF